MLVSHRQTLKRYIEGIQHAYHPEIRIEHKFVCIGHVHYALTYNYCGLQIAYENVVPIITEVLDDIQHEPKYSSPLLILCYLRSVHSPASLRWVWR